MPRCLDPFEQLSGRYERPAAVQLKQIIQKIEVDKEGNVGIYLRLLGDMRLDEAAFINEGRTYGHD